MSKLNQIKIGVDLESSSEKRIKLSKLSDDAFNGEHPNGINEGYVAEGTICWKPIIGDSLRVYYGKKCFATSQIQSIVSESETGGVFKTLNSTYKWEVIQK